jgi:hypothetical protein
VCVLQLILFTIRQTCRLTVDVYYHDSCPGGRTERFHLRFASSEIKIVYMVLILRLGLGIRVRCVVKIRFKVRVRFKIRFYGPPEWRSVLRHCITTDPGSILGCVTGDAQLAQCRLG